MGLDLVEFFGGVLSRAVDEVKEAAAQLAAEGRRNYQLATTAPSAYATKMAAQTENQASQTNPIAMAARSVAILVKSVGELPEDVERAIAAKNDREAGQAALKPMTMTMEVGTIAYGSARAGFGRRFSKNDPTPRSLRELVRAQADISQEMPSRQRPGKVASMQVGDTVYEGQSETPDMPHHDKVTKMLNNVPQ